MKKMLSILIIVGLMLPQMLICQTSNKAYLTINVNVNGVKIKINGNSYGFASTEEPILDEFNPGSYKIVAIKEGYRKNTKNIILQKGESREITFKLEPADQFEIEKDEDEGMLGLEYGSLIIVVRRDGKLVPAKVYVDGKYAENAPFTINKLTVGEHDIKAQYKGLEKNRSIQVEKNKKLQLDIELLTTSQINLISHINGIKAKIDNSVYNVPSKIDLSKGSYTFDFSKYGYKTAKRDIFINGDSNYRILVNLSKELPYISESNVGRYKKTYIKESDLKKEEYRLKKKETKRWSYPGVIACVLLCAVATGASGGPAAGGGLLGFFVGILLPMNQYTETKNERIKIYKNIDYNRNTLPNELKKINNEIDEYNEETEMLIKEKQMENYLQEAIKIYEE